MFHLGKVVQVLNGKKDEISSDGEIQAVIMMWDENLMTIKVHKKLRSKIKDGDFVLVDYSPIERINMPVPKQLIIKILRGKKALSLWERYSEYHDKKKRSLHRPPTEAPGYIS
ncbi:MAG: hypothetical protein ABIG39_05405 [Candidatus Micrarchaeota archaeon]